MVVNWAAGVEQGDISMVEIMANLEHGVAVLRPLLMAAARSIL
jgi:hypothetical protein